MDLKVFLTTFGALLLAELGDKTQLATICLTCETGKPWTVFLGAASALVAITFLAVIFGQSITSIIPHNYLQKGAALIFIIIGTSILFGWL
jgi:putative Ca2+/H+ antiporter (TMEM165/GDT1 family)